MIWTKTQDGEHDVSDENQFYGERCKERLYNL